MADEKYFGIIMGTGNEKILYSTIDEFAEELSNSEFHIKAAFWSDELRSESELIEMLGGLKR
jgi:hypothetical protein